MKTHLLPRRTVLSVLLLPVVPLVAFGHGHDGQDGIASLNSARDLLTRGIQFERAAELSRIAINEAPEDWRAWATLACALASRVASLSYAAEAESSLRKTRNQYENSLRVYEVEKKSDRTRVPPLKPPSAEIRVKDDGELFGLTPAQLTERLNSLMLEALPAFRRATELAKSPAEKAEAAHLQGWGLQLLRCHTDKFQSGSNYAPVLEAFELAVAFAPENATYRESLGDAYAVKHLFSPTEWEKVFVAWEKSVALRPENPRLWYRMALWRAGLRQRDEAKQLLQQAARYESGNAWYGYEHAGLLTEEQDDRWDISGKPSSDQKELDGLVDLREAVETLARANSTGIVRYPEYQPPVPDLLSPAWSYHKTSPRNNYRFNGPDFRFHSLILSLGSALPGYVDYVAMHENNFPEAERICRLLITCGERLRDNVTPRREVNRDRESEMVASSGERLISAGYGTLIKLLRRNDPTRATEAEKEWRLVQERLRIGREKEALLATDSKPFYLQY